MATAQDPTAAFYRTARGAVASRLLRERLSGLWPKLDGQEVLGLGYAGPYLDLWRGTAQRCVAAVPWHLGGEAPCCQVEEDRLPFADLSFDRVLLVHGLENAENVRRLLREVWRVLREDGRLLVVAPNRVGMWAHVEGTPFGQGQPYTPGQIGRLLAASLFRVERRDTALYVPPIDSAAVFRMAPALERAGRWMLPRLSGLILTEAVKDVYAAIPVRGFKRRLVLSEAA